MDTKEENILGVTGFFFFDETSLELLLYSSNYELIDAKSAKRHIM